MKANRSFMFRRDDAVSPVIAVILMVAITVVLAATVYVWASSFGAKSTSMAETVALLSEGRLDNTHKNFTIASASPGMRWSDLTFTIDGTALNQTFAATDGATACPSGPEANTRWLACAGASTEAASATVSAGDTLKFRGFSSGQTLRILDANANSVILTLTVG